MAIHTTDWPPPPIPHARHHASNGSIIAVSYEARARGVTRIMRGDQARAACPDIILVQVPIKHKKADLTAYRTAGKLWLDHASRVD